MGTKEIKNQFSILNRKINGNNLVYLDNAATTQKPERVIKSVADYYRNSNANIHRGLHTLSNESTLLYDEAHKLAAKLINAESMEQIVFTRNSTESLNLVVNSWGTSNLSKRDVVLISEMEHHSNIVPWQMLSEKIGFKLEMINIDDDGYLDLEHYDELLTKYCKRIKVVSVVHISNVLGTINPIKEIGYKAHEVGAIFIVDAAQSIARQLIDVNDIDADFLVFSSHKMYGPTGIGVLYGKTDLLEKMEPWMGGGDMISRVTKDLFEVNELPWKFEAGTPNIAGGVGFGEAVRFLMEFDMKDIISHEKSLISKTLALFKELPDVKVLGSDNVDDRLGVVSFYDPIIHPHDLATLLDLDGIAIRAGHHCAMPLHIKYQIPATSRLSFALYNTEEDIDIFFKSYTNARSRFI